MKEEDFKPIVKYFLQRFGFDVYEIEKKQGVLTPDFEVIGKSDKYTIELKIKGDDPEEISKDFKLLSRGEFLTKAIPIGPRNTLGGIIRDGGQQMIEYDPRGESFRIIWLHSAGQDPFLHNERFHSTLFGSETLFSLRLPHTITCYYFHESAFYSWRDFLDGAILTYKNKAQLCINSLSVRVEQFRKSELVLSMSNGLCDPQKLEESNDHVMIADCKIDRKRSDQVKSYLQKKYGLDHLQTIPMKQHTCAISIPMD
jgi:hypothetical protein